MANYFASSYRCTLLDFYGFGQSEIKSPLTLQDYANGVEEIIKHYDMKEVILVGHSFGGRVAILLASYLQDIKGLVLVDSAGLKPAFSFKKWRRKLDYKIRRFFKMDVSNCGSEDYKKLDSVMKATFKNVVNLYLDNLLPKIQCDSLIVWGRKDKDTPLYMAKRLKKGIKNSGLIILEGGHYSYLDSYGEFLAILDSYFYNICN